MRAGLPAESSVVRAIQAVQAFDDFAYFNGFYRIVDALGLTRLNEHIQAGEVKNHGESGLSDSLAEALVTRDGRLVYPVRDGIPILLEEESIDWNQVAE